MAHPDSPADFGVIVVGAGGAGLAAALSAAEAGASVLLTEAAGICGGSTRLSSGSFMAAGTAIQKAAGFTDDAGAFFDHYLSVNRWMCDPASRGPVAGAGVWTADAIADGARRGIIARAGTLAELARAAGIDAENLALTIARYNADCDSGADREFLKDAAVMRPVREPPFYAARMRPLAMSLTAHGLRIDADANVLDAVGRPVPGLLAAGEVVGSLIGEQYLGGGNAVGGALTFGRIAGLRAARLAAAR